MAKNDELFQEIRTHANDIKSDYSKRNREFETYEDMYLLESTEGTRGNETVKLTVSPTAHNKVAGAKRLLQSQKVRFDCHSNIATKAELDQIESLIGRWWKQMFSINGKPIMNEIVHSAALYSDVHIGLTFLEDYKKYNPDDKRIARIERRTPIIFEVWNPRFGYPERDALGLTAYYQELKVPFSYIKNTYGNLVTDTSRKDTTKVTLKRFWDLENYCLWFEEELLDCGPHELPCIPISVSSTEGSELFEDQEDRYEPLLFSLKRSLLWERENLALTTLYTTAAAIAFTPSFKWKTDSNEDLRVQMDDGIQYYRLNKGDDVEAITNKGVFTREISDIMQLTTNLIDNSTVYDTAFGTGGGSSSFSESTLLSQAARLPLVPIQRNVGAAIGDIVQIAIDIMKERGINFRFGDVEIKAKDLPEDLTIDASLDVILPQERTQLAATAATINSNGLASKEWVRSEVMGISNNDQMEKQIAQEKVSESLRDYYVQKMVGDLQNQDAMKQQQMQMQYQQQMQRNQQAVQQGIQQQMQYDMGGAQNIPVGVEQTNPNLQQIQTQAMLNNMPESNMPQVPEGNLSETAGIAGGMPSEMMGMIPQMGGM